MKRFVLPLMVLLASILALGKTAQAQHVFTAGPTLHLNFLNDKLSVSYGFEIAYWDMFGFPYGGSLGFEAEKSKLRIYTEGQTGLIIAGISAGPYLEFQKSQPLKAGLQASLWANAYLGLNVRGRFTRGKDTFALGLYAKYPWTPGGRLYEKFREQHESEGDSDWDWD